MVSFFYWKNVADNGKHSAMAPFSSKLHGAHFPNLVLYLLTMTYHSQIPATHIKRIFEKRLHYTAPCFCFLATSLQIGTSNGYLHLDQGCLLCDATVTSKKGT